MLWAILITILYYIIIYTIDSKKQKAYQIAHTELVGATTAPLELASLELANLDKETPRENSDLIGTSSSLKNHKPTELISEPISEAIDITEVPLTESTPTEGSPTSTTNDILESIDLLGQQLIKRQATERLQD